MFFKRLIKIISFLGRHPIAKRSIIRTAFNFISWQIQSRLSRSFVIVNWFSSLKLTLRKNLTGATGNYYCGLHDFEEMSFLLHFLNKEDIFYDIGANVGSYSLLASGIKGAKTYSFEPIPNTYNILKKNIAINNLSDKIIPYNIGLSEKKDTLKFSKSLDTINHVISTEEKVLNDDFIEVEVTRVDELNPEIPKLIKLDVEGFEYFVLKGFGKLIQDSRIKGIIIELNDSGKRYGIEDETINNFLLYNGFIPVKYKPFEREILLLNSFNRHGNTIYLRNPDSIVSDLKKAPKIHIRNLSY